MTVTFACGHKQPVPRDVKEPPQCACGETRITTVDAPKPRFTIHTRV